MFYIYMYIFTYLLRISERNDNQNIYSGQNECTSLFLKPSTSQ